MPWQSQTLTHRLTVTGAAIGISLYRYYTIYSRSPSHHQYLGYTYVQRMCICQHGICGLCVLDIATNIPSRLGSHLGGTRLRNGDTYMNLLRGVY